MWYGMIDIPGTCSQGCNLVICNCSHNWLLTSSNYQSTDQVWVEVWIGWGEPERAPHSYSYVLKMSVCVMLKVCLFAFGPLRYGGSFCAVECHAVMWRSWVRALQRQFFFLDRYACVLIMSRLWVRASHGQLLFFFIALQKQLWVLCVASWIYLRAVNRL